MACRWKKKYDEGAAERQKQREAREKNKRDKGNAGGAGGAAAMQVGALLRGGGEGEDVCWVFGLLLATGDDEPGPDDEEPTPMVPMPGMPDHLIDEVINLANAASPEFMMLFRDAQDAFYGADLTGGVPWTLEELHAMLTWHAASNELQEAMANIDMLIERDPTGETWPVSMPPRTNRRCRDCDRITREAHRCTIPDGCGYYICEDCWPAHDCLHRGQPPPTPPLANATVACHPCDRNSRRSSQRVGIEEEHRPAAHPELPIAESDAGYFGGLCWEAMAAERMTAWGPPIADETPTRASEECAAQMTADAHVNGLGIRVVAKVLRQQRESGGRRCSWCKVWLAGEDSWTCRCGEAGCYDCSVDPGHDRCRPPPDEEPLMRPHTTRSWRENELRRIEDARARQAREPNLSMSFPNPPRSCGEMCRLDSDVPAGVELRDQPEWARGQLQAPAKKEEERENERENAKAAPAAADLSDTCIGPGCTRPWDGTGKYWSHCKECELEWLEKHPEEPWQGPILEELEPSVHESMSDHASSGRDIEALMTRPVQQELEAQRQKAGDDDAGEEELDTETNVEKPDQTVVLESLTAKAEESYGALEELRVHSSPKRGPEKAEEPLSPNEPVKGVSGAGALPGDAAVPSFPVSTPNAGPGQEPVDICGLSAKRPARRWGARARYRQEVEEAVDR